MLEKMLKRLVALPTVTENTQANDAALGFMAEFLAERGMYVERFAWNGHGSLVATTRATKRPKVLLVAHVDVVPAAGGAQFSLQKRSGRYGGRGVYDMKFALASFLCLADELRGELSRYDFGIMITSDEETGSQDGVVHLVEAGFGAEVCIVPDGGVDWQIVETTKGVEWYDIEVHGKTAHGARPWQGESAAVKLMRLLAELHEHFKDQHAHTDTVNVGTVQAGEATNQVPALARASLDVRFASIQSMAATQAYIQNLCKKYNAKMTRSLTTPPQTAAKDHPLVRAFADEIAAELGHSPGFTTAFGSCDARFFEAKGMPCVVVCPPGGGHHGPDEWLDVAGLGQFHNILCRYIAKTAKVNVR